MLVARPRASEWLAAGLGGGHGELVERSGWMSWLRERVESKTRRTVPVPPRNEPWLPSVLAHVAPDLVSALTYAVAWTTWGGCDISTTGLSRLRFQRATGRQCLPNAASRRCYVIGLRGSATRSG